MQLVINNKATLKSQLDVCKQPIVGLDHVIEYIDPDGISPRVYQCTLCNTWRSVATVMEHLTGYKHRVLYIVSYPFPSYPPSYQGIDSDELLSDLPFLQRLHYPNQARMYLNPDQRTANRTINLMKMAALRCNELELVYGRGDYKTVHDKPNFDEIEMDKDDEDIILNEGQTTEGLKKILEKIKDVKLECDEDINVAKAIINALTDAIIEFRNAK